MRVEQTTARTASQPVAAREPVALPYSPSWIDRLMSWVQRLPLPYGITYLILFVAEVVTLHVLSWVDGSLPLFHFHPLYLLFPLWLWGPLAIMTYLDEVALHALREFQPLLGKHEDEIPRLQYELATLPSRSVWISGLFWTGVFLVVMYAGFPVVVRQYSYGPIGVMTAWISGVFSFGIGSALYYHTIRQLRLVSRILGLVERVNLFQLEPVYAFARLTAQTGVSWVSVASCSAPSRRYTTWAGASLLAAMISIIRSAERTGCPLIWTNTSPFRRPASSATVTPQTKPPTITSVWGAQPALPIPCFSS